MATTGFKISEQVQRILASGTPTDDFEPRVQEIWEAVKQNLAESVFNQFMAIKGVTGDSYVPGEYVVAFDEVPVLEDTKKKLRYSTIPSTALTLPHDMGVYQISLQEDQDTVFVPFTNGVQGLLTGLEVQGLAGRFGFWREDTRVYYENVKEDNKFDQVLMKLVITGTAQEIDDPIEIAPNLEAEVVRNTVQLFLQSLQLPHDETNDLIDG